MSTKRSKNLTWDDIVALEDRYGVAVGQPRVPRAAVGRSRRAFSAMPNKCEIPVHPNNGQKKTPTVGRHHA